MLVVGTCLCISERRVCPGAIGGDLVWFWSFVEFQAVTQGQPVIRAMCFFEHPLHRFPKRRFVHGVMLPVPLILTVFVKHDNSYISMHP